MANYRVEDILKEYGPDGKRSGIQQDGSHSLSHGTLETEKLIHAATSKKPLSREIAGYRHVSEIPVQEEMPTEDLVDIKSTISDIKAHKEAQAVREAGVSPLLRERFPTQHLRQGVSYLNAGGSAHAAYVPETDAEFYDGAVKLTSPTIERNLAQEMQHRPNIRQMQDSTRAKEKKHKRQKRMTEASYVKESISGVLQPPLKKSGEEPISPRSRETESVFYGQDSSEMVAPHVIRHRSHRRQSGTSTTSQPDDMDLVRKKLRSLRNVIFFRCIALLLLTLLGAVFAYGESFFMTTLQPRGYAAVQLVMALLTFAVSLPTVKNGLWHFIRFHADSDSMAAVPLVLATLGAVFAVIYPTALSQEMVHLYVPCATMAMLCNAIGRLLIVRRAFRNCNVLFKNDANKRVLSYVTQEETAELLTKGLLHDFPIVAAVRKADAFCDFLRYTYSMDAADNFCRTVTPISLSLSLVVSIFLTIIRLGTMVNLLWVNVLFSLMTMLVTASCCLGCALVANLPLERESKKAAATGNALLGYQSVDDFFDVNALLVEAKDLFPKGSVQVQGMKVFSGAKVDDVLLDAASLVQHSESILQDAFADMISDHQSLHEVDEFVCEDGLGLCGWIANRRVLLGGREMMMRHNVEGLPTKTRETEMIEGNGDVLYLSVSGVLSAMFSMRITADSIVCRQMRALRQEHVGLVIRTVDSSITLHRLSALFAYPEQLLKIIPTSMHHLFQRETAPLGCVSASAMVGKTGFGAAQLLLSARRVRRAAMAGTIMQIVSAILGLSLAMIHVVTGSYESMTAQFFLLYHLLLTVITVLITRLR